MVLRVHRLALMLLLLGPAFASAAESGAVDALIRDGEAHLRAASSGAAGAADRALAAFDAALAADPAQARARAGRGLALIAQALNAPMAEKLPLARRGCAELDAAVDLAPDDPNVRLMRATSAVQMPLLLERRTIAVDDFAVLVEAARNENVTMPPATRRGIFFQAAAFSLKERRAGAVELLEEASLIAADEPSDEQVQSMLALARRQITSPSHADRHPPEKASASGP